MLQHQKHHLTVLEARSLGAKRWQAVLSEGTGKDLFQAPPLAPGGLPLVLNVLALDALSSSLPVCAHTCVCVCTCMYSKDTGPIGLGANLAHFNLLICKRPYFQIRFPCTFAGLMLKHLLETVIQPITLCLGLREDSVGTRTQSSPQSPTAG